MTDQEIFNKVWQYFIVEKHPQGASSIGAKVCKYRTLDGKKCAFGILIPDDKYTPYMEGRSSSEVIRQYLPEFIPNSNIISALQNVHDMRAINWHKMLENSLRTVAGKYFLQIPEENQ